MEPAEPQPQPQISPASLASSGQPWLASGLLQRQVVNTTTLEPVGRVADIVFDPESCQVTALIVQSPAPGGELAAAVRRTIGLRRTIAAVKLDHVIALNGDVVTIVSDPVLSAGLRSMGRVARLCEVCELTIITLHGMCLGSLADLLLDSPGRVVTGYVVNPTKQARSLLQPLEDLALWSPPPTAIEGGAGADTDGATEAAPASAPSAAHLRVIPASPHVRIGEALIVVVEGAEPVQQETVVITSRSGERTRDAAHHNGVYWPWTRRSELH